MQFVAIPSLTSGTRTYIGTVTDGGVSGGPYQVSVRVTTTNGKITRVQDNGTEGSIDDDSDHAFWSGYSVMESDGMPAKLRGKSLENVLNMQTVPDDDAHNVDAVSGATVWSDAIRHATIAALRSAPVSESESTVLAPTLTAQTCVPNASYKYIDVAMSADKDCTIRYTLDSTDPDKNSPEAAKIGWSGDIGVRLKPDLTKYPNGQVIEVRAAAFDKDGNRSDVVRQFYIFANPLKNAAYTATYSGVSAEADGITATIVTESPNYDNYNYITSLKLDSAHSEQYADFLPELFSRIYLAQTTEGVKPIEGHEQESQAVLSAVQAALNKALTASKPTLTVSPEKTTYANADAVTVTLDCPTNGAEIYYTVDNSTTMTGSTLSDPTKTGTKYENSLSESIGDIAGGTLYIRAAAKKDGKWSGIVRKDLTFAKGVKENAFVVDGTNYQSWSAAAAAVKKDGTIVLNDDVQLTEEDKLPDVACTIRSADGETKYRLSGSPMTMNADLTLSNISYALGNLYANGHDLTVSNDVETAWSFTDYSLYAGSTVNSTAASTQHISVQAGDFAVIASGRGSTTHKADVDVAVGGSAEVELAGAYMGATLDGNVTFHVADGVKLNQFLGEQSGGSVTRNLTLQIKGTPTLKSYNPTYKASVKRDSFGTLDLTGAATDFITENRNKFTGFATVLPTA
ncbi:FN3 associated domain-containing protein [Agathobaculum hominis]|uniref:Chitobiase/beta-hexosaminidase C-terminal domain-containing protein n=1 Tax=Agathobaculum hominis TaxID=2763014 RepID=A0ABR7GKJ2_9FIRM|nr:chitobiase/beta-hexosaminidase C-terminal domain-containing protein [Agathobaculum hominis]